MTSSYSQPIMYILHDAFCCTAVYWGQIEQQYLCLAKKCCFFQNLTPRPPLTLNWRGKISEEFRAISIVPYKKNLDTINYWGSFGRKFVKV